MRLSATTASRTALTLERVVSLLSICVALAAGGALLSYTVARRAADESVKPAKNRLDSLGGKPVYEKLPTRRRAEFAWEFGYYAQLEGGATYEPIYVYASLTGRVLATKPLDLRAE